MILLLFIFIAVLIILYFLSRALLKNIYCLFFLITKNRNSSIQLLSWLLLPGIVIHEVSHMLIAELFGVKTGEFSFVPEVMADNKIKAGSLKLVKTDPLRQSLIGLAPVFIGLTIIYIAFQFLLTIQPYNHITIKPLFLLLIIGYLLFVISNTMFSSSKDLETILFPLSLLIIILGVFWLTPFQINLSPAISLFFANLFKNLSLGIAITISVDLLFLGIIKSLLLLFSKKTRL